MNKNLIIYILVTLIILILCILIIIQNYRYNYETMEEIDNKQNSNNCSNG